MKKVKTYKVAMWYQEIGVSMIKATSEKNAEKQAVKMMKEEGNIIVNVKDRDYGVGSVEEFK